MNLSVVGTSRSGSTMIREMLHLHPRLALFNETHWLPRMYESCGAARVRWRRLLSIALKTTWHDGQDLFDVNLKYSRFRNRDDLIETLTERLSARGYIGVRDFHEIAADVCLAPAAQWGDKTPDYGFYMGLVQGLWPACRFLHVVRNGLDTARSMSRHEGCQLMAAAGYDNWCPLSFDHLYDRYRRREESLDAHVASWRRRLARIRVEAEGLRPGSYMEVRYEDLVGQTDAVLTAIAAWLDLSPDPAWVAEARRLVRPGRRAPDPPLLRALSLLPDDLRALDREGDLRFWKTPIPDSRSEVLRLLHDVRASAASRQDRVDAARVGIAAICSEAALVDIALTEAAVAAIRPAVMDEAGLEGAMRWDAWLEDVRAAAPRAG